ncbi:MFS family permease [Endobacter medicaginis]|uniref:MFS family permease n=1 Tax=Endobacter medicaginis TaxID=1181271 RepID=A0A850NJZ0_9PROT|nr:MFS transporter [Endobacter medicaginis]MBB3174825.1 MFS family permease [Endobacter medicaginis]MCX5475643.1 MFS transporter [Endobacter medicaginis]NVN30151.1 MFS transporter [Endobacter medicaginis]
MSALVSNADDVSRLVNEGPRHGSHARIVVLLALGGIFLDAYDLTTLSYGIGDVQRHFHLSDAGTGLVAAALNAGTILGALIGGWLTDRFGRYAIFMADMAFFVVAALAAGFAPSAPILIAARLAMGFGVGMDLPVAMAFLAEFSRLDGPGSKAQRAAAWCPTWYAASSVCFTLIFALYFALPAQHVDWLWRASLAFGAVPALVIIAVRSRFMAESPVWVAKRGQLARAVAILRDSYGIDAVLDPHAQVTPERKPRPSYLVLLKPPYLRRFVLINGFGAASAFAYSAIAFGLPGILSGVLHQGRLGVLAVSLVMNLAFAFTGGLLGVRLTRSLPSLWLTVAGYAVQLGSAVTLALIGIPHDAAQTAGALAALAAFLFAQGFGPGCQCMVYPTLSYPTMLRGTGVGLSRAISSLATTVSLMLLPGLNHHLGTQAFWVVACAPALGIAILLAMRWEVFGYDADADPALQHTADRAFWRPGVAQAAE